jgi:hypothetical protein
MPTVERVEGLPSASAYQAPVSDLVAIPIDKAVRLAAPSGAEVALVKSTGRSDAVAFGRVPQMDTTTWAQPTSNTIRISVTSTGAKALRVGVRLVSGVHYQIASWGPSDLSAVVMQTGGSPSVNELVWTGITPGETQEIVITRLEPAPNSWGVDVARISHFDADVLSTSSTFTPSIYGESQSAYCQVDVACVLDLLTPTQQQVALGGTRGVMLLLLTYSTGQTFYCTGTLLNTARNPEAIVITANHCIAGDDGAETLVGLTTLYFFSRPVCGSTALANYVQVVSTGTTLWHSLLLDSALLKIDQLPPSPASYEGWNANDNIDIGDYLLAVHHPRGDVKKASLADLAGTVTVPATIGPVTYPAGTFYLVNWDFGIVEPGSSGSGIFTGNEAGTSLQLRGTLTGGSATCSKTKAATFYSKLSNIYPFIRSYLEQPDVPPPPPPPPPPTGGKVQVIEYYNASINHYFITPNSVEIGLLGKPPFQAWQPTGLSFLAYSQSSPPVGTVGVCRFFNDHFLGISTHFYAPHGLGCEQVLAGFPDWTIEDPQLFYAHLPDTSGNCPVGDLPVYRLFNNGKGGAPNHRFTTDYSVRQQMIAQGYTPEGAGVGVGWCATQ